MFKVYEPDTGRIWYAGCSSSLAGNVLKALSVRGKRIIGTYRRLGEVAYFDAGRSLRVVK